LYKSSKFINISKECWFTLCVQTREVGLKEQVFHPEKTFDVSHRGTDVMILKNIFAKKSAKELAFLTPNKAKF
jgi:hypothetical protein